MPDYLEALKPPINYALSNMYNPMGVPARIAGLFADEPVQAADHSDAWLARDYALSQEEQNRLALIEHEALMREEAAKYPGIAMASGWMPPVAYEMAKYMGMVGGRSDPSIQSLMSGLSGVRQGIFDGL